MKNVAAAGMQLVSVCLCACRRMRSLSGVGMVAISALTLILHVVLHQYFQRKMYEPLVIQRISIPAGKLVEPIAAAPEVPEDAGLRTASKFSNALSWSP